LRDFDENGKETMFAYVFAGRRDETVTRGWLRASHRALDIERTLPHQPYHPHTHNDWLTPNVPVAVDVEIWPTGMVFKAGHRIGLTVHCGQHEGIRDIQITMDSLSSGTYAVRSRLRSLDIKDPAAVSGWSPPSTFQVG
jgi:predicted acyl esterase